MAVPGWVKKRIPWRTRHALRRLQARLDPRRSVRIPIHTERTLELGAAAKLVSPVENAWDHKHENRVESSWASNPLVLQALARRQTGSPDRFWLDWMFQDGVKERVGRLLSVGCGAGGHEQIIARNGYADRIDAFDASPAGIRKAKEDAAASGFGNIDFRVGTFEDFAENGPDEAIYDAVLFAGSLHHVRDLEGMLSRVRRVLKPSGWLLFNEYVGPLYAIYPPARVALLDHVLAALPAEFKRAPDVRWVNPTIDTVMRVDPSEGVRSSLILDLLGLYFRFEQKRFFGGGLLHPIFDLLDTERLADGSPESNAIVTMLIEIEDLLTENGVLESDMCLGICRQR